MGRQFSDSPRYIYEAAVASGLDRLGLTPVWSHARPTPKGFPAGVRTVQRDTWRYLYLLARAEFWVDNQGLPRQYSRRKETTYIQTWHGTPLKRMGFDSPALERASAATRRTHRAMMKRWSALLAPSEYFVETFVRSFRYEGAIVRHGLPRNDLLVRGVDRDWVDAKKRELGLPTDRRLVLVLPHLPRPGAAAGQGVRPPVRPRRHGARARPGRLPHAAHPLPGLLPAARPAT